MKGTDFSTYRLTPLETLRFGAEGLLAALSAAFLFYDRILAVIPLLILVPVRLRSGKRQRISERKRQLRDGLGDLVHALLFSFRAGRSAETAFTEAGRSIRDSLGLSHPLCREWELLEKRMALGQSPESLLADLADRSGVEELEDLAAVFSAAKRSGGNMVNLLESAAGRLGDAIDTQREIETAVAARKAEHRLMSFTPCGIILYMRLCSPGYLDPMYRTLPGILTMTLCLASFAAAVVLGERITRIEI